MSFPVGADDFKAVIPDPTSTLCGNFVRALLKLPVLIYKFVNFMINNDGDLTDDFKALIVGLTFSPGDIKLSGVSLGDGWLSCDGSPVSRATYATLFAAIGEVFGPGDGVNTFNVPDFRDHYAIGQSGTRTIGTKVNNGADDYKHLLTVNELPVHHHYVGATIAGVAVTDEPGYLFTAGDDVRFNQVATSDKAAITRDESSDVPATADQDKIVLPLPPAVAVAFYIKT